MKGKQIKVQGQPILECLTDKVGKKKGPVSIQANDNTAGRSLRLEANSGKFLTVETNKQ